jgi:hypothetical protein
MSRTSLKLVLLATALLLPLSSQFSASKETLVLLDNLAIKETHSIFFKALQGT